MKFGIRKNVCVRMCLCHDVCYSILIPNTQQVIELWELSFISVFFNFGTTENAN